MHYITSILAVLVSYLLGSINFSIIISKLTHNTDPRLVGSNNAGATNMLRNFGYKYGLITLVADTLKGYVAITIASCIINNDPYGTCISAIAIIIGHTFPIFFRFKGGKGVASCIGVLFFISWQICLFSIAVWGIVFLICRIVSIASMLAIIAAASVSVFYLKNIFVVLITILAIIIIINHRVNINRLITGDAKPPAVN